MTVSEIKLPRFTVRITDSASFRAVGKPEAIHMSEKSPSRTCVLSGLLPDYGASGNNPAPR